MAVIIKIRNKLGIVMVVLIALAIAGFLLMDAVNSNSNILQGRKDSVGSIDGEDLSIMEYEKEVERSIQNYMLSNPNAKLDNLTRQNLRDQTYEQFVQDHIMDAERNLYGLTVTPEEIFEMVQGQNVHPQVRQAFTNPETGQFSSAQVINYLRSLDTNPEEKVRWLSFEKFLKTDRLTSKYNNLVKKSIYVPQWQLQTAYNDRMGRVDFNYVYLPFSDISDNDIQVTDAELNSYIKKHKNKFEQVESRSIQYVSFNVVPSSVDSAQTLSWLEDKLQGFVDAKSDSIYVRRYSNQPYNYRYLSKTQLTSSIKDTLFTLDTGTVYGPYLENGYYKLTKVVDRKLLPDSANISQILLIPTTQEEVALFDELADSLVEAINNGADFGALALKYSNDEATKMNGGNIGWIKPGEVFTTINDAVFFYKEKGAVFRAPSDQGYHIIRIEESTPEAEKIKLATISRIIMPSSETRNKLYQAASDFAAANTTAEAFDQSSATMTVYDASNIRRNDFIVPQLGLSRELVSWVYANDVNDVSDVFVLEEQFIVAKITAAYDDGVQSLDNVRLQVEQEVKNEKKADQLISQIQSGGSDLNSIASATGKSVQTATSLTMENFYIQGAGSEPTVVATAMVTPLNSLSQPIEGNTGVFVVMPTNVVAPTPVEDYNPYRQGIVTPILSRVDFELYNAIKETYDFEDTRYEVYR